MAEREAVVSGKATIVSVKATPASASDLLFPALYRRKALALLFLRPERRLHVREVSRLTSTSPGTMKKELDQLHRAGLLERHVQGNQVQFSANQTHPVFPELSGLLRKTVGLADVLTDALAAVADRVEVAFVFGSIARASEHAGSDVDVIVIGDIGFSDVLTALYAAQQTLQREINPKVFSLDEWRSKIESGSSFLLEVLVKPKIFLIGQQHDLDALGQSRENRPA
jgi:predicted nucleotidyltransferase